MIPRVAIRGHSFKGAGAYYLHDKKADTSERVGWTHTHNLPTNDAEKAMKVMAFTAMHSEDLKRNAGVKLTGRKSTLGEVYSFSLAWNPAQNPTKEEMLESSLNTLEKLNLQDHQSVIVYHQETDHKHVHVICNLINPNDGKMAKIYNDYLIFSEWAEQKEKEDGKIYCDERVINNKIRNGIDPDPNEISKRDQKREEKKQRKILVQDLYTHSDSGKAFASALEFNDLTLAKGDRRGYVLVDQEGNIHSVSRMLKGITSSDLKARLADLIDLPNGKQLSDDRKHFDRDQYEIDRQKFIVDSAIEESKRTPKPRLKSKFDDQKSDLTDVSKDEDYKTLLLANFEQEKRLRLLDFDRVNQNKIIEAQEKFEQALQLGNSKNELLELQNKLKKKSGIISKAKKHDIEVRIEQVQREIKESKIRVQEQLDSFRQKVDAEKEQYIKDNLTFDVEKRLEEIKHWQKERLNDLNDQPNKTDDYDPPELLI